MQDFVTAADTLKSAADGDSKLIEQICLDMWEPLYRFLYWKVQNREEAEDITQETFVKTLTYLQEHQSPGDNFLGFMKIIALNIIRDRWRQNKRRGVPINIEAVSLEETAGVDPQTLIAQRLQIENALAKLSEDQRAVLDLRIVKGYSVAETARLVGKTEAAVRTSQYRALQGMAQILDDSD